jgi:hypothetical protein
MKAKAPYPHHLGNKSELVTLLDGADVPSGLIKLRNIGKFTLIVGALDARGNPLEPHLVLKPGEAISSYAPPANAAKVVLVADTLHDGDDPNVTGEVVLQYDVPWYA